MAHANERIRITPRSRSIYAQLKRSTDERERAQLECALHGAVGMFPWSSISVDDVLVAFEHEQS